MNLFVCVVGDLVSGAWSDPFVSRNEKEAVRAFGASLDNPNLPDYVRRDSVLYCVGTVTADIGTYHLNPYDTPVCLATGSAFSVAVDSEVTADA